MNRHKILMVDDEAAIRKFLRVSLEAEGYSVAEAASGKEGLLQAATQRPDLVVLDLGLSDMDGLEMLKTLREWSTVPVLVLTVRDSERDKVALLDAGADDYLTKPFGIPELLARLRVALRHRVPSSGLEPVFRSGPLEIDFSARQVKMRGQEVRLSATEYGILCLLARHAGKVVLHRQILKEIWGPNSVEHTQYLRVYVGHLRKKLEGTDSKTSLILTEPGVGYRLKMET